MISSLTAPRNWPIWAFIISAAMLAVAHAFERIALLAPCPLCLRQREVYWVALTIAAIGYVAIIRFATPRHILAVNAALCLVFLVGTAVAVYHAGVEWKFWEGPKDCATSSGGDFGNGADLLESLDQKMAIVSCSDAAWRMFGISMAGYNAMISLGLTVISAVMALRSSKRIPA